MAESVLARVRGSLHAPGGVVPGSERAPAASGGDGVPLGVLTDLVTWHDPHGDVVRSGADSGHAFGFSQRALTGEGYLARVHISDRPVFLKALSDAGNGADPVQVEFRLHAGDEKARFGHGSGDRAPVGGKVVWVEMRAHRLDPDAASGSGATVIAFTRDMSGPRQHAEDLERARLEAERADAVKGRFLATVSHELRTPLNAIIGFSELLGADHPFVITEERRKEYATIIRNSGAHLLEIVNTLLDMSKIESGTLSFEPEPFSLHDLVVGCCDLMQLKADEGQVTLKRLLAPDLPDLLGDRRACRQILINLLSNAIKFTPAGGSVTVSLGLTAAGHMISVADTGIGIPESDLPRLGDPFFQSGDVHRRHHEGTGLGLSVVKGLVGLHGGEISIESQTGSGTIVTLTLPGTQPADEMPARAASVRILTQPTTRLNGRRTA